MLKSKSKRANQQTEKSSETSHGKRRTLMLTAIITIVLIITSSVLAQWVGVLSITQKTTPKAGELSPASFNANVPAKEYIYAGGKLIATEEPQSACTITLSASSQSFAANTGTGTVGVIAGGGCPWTAISNASWLTINSGSPGNGNGNVLFSVATNGTTGIRNGTITIGGQVFTIYQGIQFNDVAVGAPFYNEISKLSARSVTLGCSTNPPLYCPSQLVNREQMAAFIIRSLGEFNPPQPVTQRFTDVPPSNIFYNFIDRLAVLNITAGCSATTYCPSDIVTHDQMAAFIIRALGMPNPPPPTTQRFADVPPTHPFYAFIDQMAARGIWTGCNGIPGNTYCPSNQVTREQMAAILVRAFNL